MLQPHLCHLLFAVLVPQGQASLCHPLTLKVFLEPFLCPLCSSLPGTCRERCFYSGVIVLPRSMRCAHVSSLPCTVQPFIFKS